MAQFRGWMQGQRGGTSRLGSKRSGLQATVDGWDAGIEVRAVWDEILGVDVFYVYATGGSNGRGGLKLIFSLRDIQGDSELQRAARVAFHCFENSEEVDG